MKRMCPFILLVLLFLGCASTGTQPLNDADVKNAPAEDSKKAIESTQQGIQTGKVKDGGIAKTSIIKAGKQLDEENKELRIPMKTAAFKLRKIIDMSGFEYAPKKSFDLLVIYLEMQNAYIDKDTDTLKDLEVQFNATYQEVLQTTVTEKQKRLEELGQEVEEKSDEIKKQAEEDIFEIFPTIYMVKKGDTLPSIAARHEIYNDSYMWPLVYKANRDQIKDPKIIYVGQDLKIPREMTIEEIIEARREAGAPDPQKIPKEAFIPRRNK